MSFQKCPLCNGTGLSPFPSTYSTSTTTPCPTCKGARIISELTGKPPIVEEKHSIFEPVDNPCNADPINAFICNPEYRQNDLANSGTALMDELSKTYKISIIEDSTQTPTQNSTQNGSNISSREP